MNPPPCLTCRYCGHSQGHATGCPVPEHEAALTLANHDPEECYLCLLQEEVRNTCRCGLCCRRLLIEVGLADAEREPRIKERGSPLYTPPELTASGQRELEGYLLNGPDVACVFLDQATNACTIYASRPLTCRLFDCDGDGREQLLTLGLLPRAENREEGEEVP